MTRRAALGLGACLVVACVPPPGPRPPGPAPAAIVAPPPILDVSPVGDDPGTVLREVCAPGEEPTEGGAIEYDFDDEHLAPLPFGPRFRHVPPTALPRSRASVARAVRLREGALRACYRWARRAAPDLSADLRVRLPIRRFGEVETPTVTTDVEAAEPLAACVAEVLTGAPMDMVSDRDAVAELHLRFAPDPATPQPRGRPRRPGAPAPRPPIGAGSCAWIPAGPDGPVDVAPPFPILRLSDGPVGHAPAVVSPPLSARHLRTMVRSNLGAYRECVIEARRRAPTGEGRVVVQARIDAAGTFREVAVVSREGGDDALGACLRDALAEVRVRPPLDGRRTILRYSFVFDDAPGALPEVASAGTPEQLAADADALLEAGDGEGALARYETLLAFTAGHPDECRWEVGALRAAIVARPFGDDRARDLARRLSETLARGAAPESCIADAEAALRDLVSRPMDFTDRDAPYGRRVPEAVVDAYEWLVVASPPERALGDIRDALEAALRQVAEIAGAS